MTPTQQCQQLSLSHSSLDTSSLAKQVKGLENHRPQSQRQTQHLCQGIWTAVSLGRPHNSPPSRCDFAPCAGGVVAGKKQIKPRSI